MNQLTEAHAAVGLLCIGDALESKAGLHSYAETCQAPSHRFLEISGIGFSH